jgi:hypothetical protein
MSEITSETNSAAGNTAQQEPSISLEDAIEQFTRDLAGKRHSRMTTAIRKLKAGFTRSQLTSTNREFVAGTMEELMRYMVRTFIRHGRVNTKRLTPLVRSLVLSKGDRALVERYLTQVQHAKAGAEKSIAPRKPSSTSSER